MPELPEVETIRRKLESVLTGRRITGVMVRDRRIVGHPRACSLARGIAGRRITGTRRRGKYLILEMDDRSELVFHLRLSGHLEFGPAGQEPRFERLRLVLSGGKVLSFAEPRVLGRVYLVGDGSRPSCLAGMERMGPEPIQPEFTAEYLAGQLRRKTASIKSVLLDQKVCCGVGNIYSDEALFRAEVRPTRPAGSLKPAEVKRLALALRAVLLDGIRWCGTTLGDDTYRLPDGARGEFQKHLRVVGREGKPCRRPGCGGTIRLRRFGNRSSRYCPRCQR